MATQIDLGAVVPIGKGDWNPSTTYERANIVRHNSVAWICKVATSLGVEPTEDSSDWYLLVKDTSSVTSINGMKGDVTIDSVLENPSIDDNSLKIASTAWTNTKISQVDSTANVALQTANTALTSCLPLTGGTMIGSITFSNNGKVAEIYATPANASDWRYVNLVANGNGSNGGSFQAFMTNSPNHAGGFTCRAEKNGVMCDLYGTPEGMLTWNNSQVLLPPGSVFAFAGNNVPVGCLPCDGAAVSRTTYVNLFKNIGTLYGKGNGSTTFNLPDLRGKFIQGEWNNNNPGSVKEAGLPNITGGAAVADNGISSYWLIGNLWGALAAEKRSVNRYLNTNTGNWQQEVAGFNINASRSNSIYGKSSTVQPPAVTLRYCIKY